MLIRANKPVDSHASARQTNDLSLTEMSAMKLVLQTIALLLIIPTIVAAQTQTRERRTGDLTQASRTEPDAVRNRVVSPKASNHVDSQKISPDSKAKSASEQPEQEEAKATSQPAWGNTSVIIRPGQNDRIASASTLTKTTSVDQIQTAPRKLVQPTSLVADPSARAAANTPALTAARTAPTSTYNVGTGDVLDVRLSNWPTRESTLFTVMRDGTIEYPLLGGPISVIGLTTDEVANLLSGQIKVINSARVTVSVREYASHSVVVIGLVDSPGRKMLRREAMPLYTVLAEALVRPEATTATVTRNGKEGETLNLKDEQAMSKLVLPGDMIKISIADLPTKRFLYVGGEVTSPGEKFFRDGMTLTQAILSAGGAPHSPKTTITVSRRNARGFLSTTEYSLRSIEEGKTQDPLVEAGDRIEVNRVM
jgi:protein involved in polysaccharide export with SLBB domain